MVENTNQNCQLNWLDEKRTIDRTILEEIISRNLVVGGHNGSSTATFICQVSDDNFTRGYNILSHTYLS